SRELLTIQPHTRVTRQRAEAAYAVATDRDQALLDRGCRIRTLYQHTLRHSPLTVAHQERLRGDIEARALDELTDRLIIATPTLTLLSGKKRINEAITAAMADASRELLTIQPHTRVTRQRAEAAYAVATDRDQALLDRGCRIRTLYQHTLRHSPLTVAHQERPAAASAPCTSTPSATPP
ncbi:hypothetical protein CA983_44645, partial [Streptomyces swartbergensis]